LGVGEALTVDETDQGMAVLTLEFTDHEIGLGWISAGDIDGRDTLHDEQSLSSRRSRAPLRS